MAIIFLVLVAPTVVALLINNKCYDAYEDALLSVKNALLGTALACETLIFLLIYCMQ